MDKVSVVFDEAYDRIRHPDTYLENSIAEVILNFRIHLLIYCGVKIPYLFYFVFA